MQSLRKEITVGERRTLDIKLRENVGPVCQALRSWRHDITRPFFSVPPAITSSVRTGLRSLRPMNLSPDLFLPRRTSRVMFACIYKDPCDGTTFRRRLLSSRHIELSCVSGSLQAPLTGPEAFASSILAPWKLCTWSYRLTCTSISLERAVKLTNDTTPRSSHATIENDFFRSTSSLLAAQTVKGATSPFLSLMEQGISMSLLSLNYRSSWVEVNVRPYIFSIEFKAGTVGLPSYLYHTKASGPLLWLSGRSLFSMRLGLILALASTATVILSAMTPTTHASDLTATAAPFPTTFSSATSPTIPGIPTTQIVIQPATSAIITLPPNEFELHDPRRKRQECFNDQGFSVNCATWTGYYYTWGPPGNPYEGGPGEDGGGGGSGEPSTTITLYAGQAGMMSPSGMAGFLLGLLAFLL